MGDNKSAKLQGTKRKNIPHGESAKSTDFGKKRKFVQTRSQNLGLPLDSKNKTKQKPVKTGSNKSSNTRKVLLSNTDNNETEINDPGKGRRNTRSRSRSRSRSKSVETGQPCSPIVNDVDLDQSFDGNDNVQVMVPPAEDTFGVSDDESIADEGDYEENSSHDYDSTNFDEDREVTFPGKESLAQKIDKLKKDPQYREILGQLLQEKAQQGSNLGIVSNDDNDNVTEIFTPDGDNNNRTNNSSKTARNVKGDIAREQQLVKSPSDSTLYTLALRKVTEEMMALNQISNFVENIRLETQGDGTPDRRQHTPMPSPNNRRRLSSVVVATPMDQQPRPGTSHGHRDDDRQVKETTDWILLDAERFKASIAAPKGNFQPNDINNSEVEWLRKFDNDDDFFHVTCHIDANLKGKIEHGEFIDLDRLLPKDHNFIGVPHAFNDSHKLELMVKDGHPYFGAVQGENKINSVKKWDQAFRVYASIYSQANPQRAGEIWQYVHIIHTAASTYHWDNVAYYDYIFRQLMAVKPWRSWAKTYTQG